MKTLFKNHDMKLVDNEHDYDFVGWLDNLTNKTLILIFLPGESTRDEESDEEVFNEDLWEVDEVCLCNEEELEMKREFIEENNSYPFFAIMVEIGPHKCGGFLADNRGRSMFNALKKHLEN